MFSLICSWINGWVYSREAGDLGRHRAHYDVTVMEKPMTYKSATPVTSAGIMDHMGKHDIGSNVEEDL